MLDLWIIEEILKRERSRRTDRPVVEIQIPAEPIEEERGPGVRRGKADQATRSSTLPCNCKVVGSNAGARGLRITRSKEQRLYIRSKVPLTLLVMLGCWFSDTADAFCVRRFDDGGSAAWNRFPVRYKISENLQESATIEAIDSAFANWADIRCSDLSFEKAGTFDPQQVPFGNISEQAIYIYWFDSASGFPISSNFVAYLVPEKDDSGVMVRGSLAVNAFSQSWSTDVIPDADKFDVHGEMTSLIGELLGLATSNSSDSVMRAQVLAGTSDGRTLGQDDVQAIQYLYPSSEGAGCPADTLEPGPDGCASPPRPVPVDGGIVTPPDAGVVDASSLGPVDDSGVRRCVSREQCILGEYCTLEGICRPIPNEGCCRIANSDTPAGPEDASAAGLFVLGLAAHLLLRRRHRRRRRR